jgi:NAD(P)H dehydrogenase (quinone)
MIVVTGATGKLGRLVVQHLLELVPVDRIAVSVRDPGKAAALIQQGIRVRHGDFARPDSLAAAFEGATQVLVVSSNASAYGGDSKAQHQAAIAAAKVAGARRIVYTSHMAASTTSAFLPMHVHAATEGMLGASGIAWTALRNGFYAESARQLTADAAKAGEVVAPQDGKFSWTAHEDLAAAAAIILANEGRFDGPTPPLTAPAALDFTDIANLLSEISGQSITRKTPTDDEFELLLAARGLPPAVIAITLSMYRAARAGEFARTDPTLGTLLGREPISARQILAS